MRPSTATRDSIFSSLDGRDPNDSAGRVWASFKFRHAVRASQIGGICEDIIIVSVARRLRSRAVLDAADEGQHRRDDAVGRPHSRRERARPTTAAANPATPFSAASTRSSTASSMVSPPTGAPAPTATWRRTISSSRRPAWRRGFSSCNSGGGGIRMPTIRCSGRSMRMTSARTARTPVTSAISVRTASSGSRSGCRPTSGSSIRRPTSRRAETEVDVWRSVPTVNDVTLTGPDNGILWPRGPNQAGGYQLDGRFATLAGAGARGIDQSRAVQSAPPQQLLDDLSSFQRVLFTNERVRALSNAVREGTAPLPDPDRRLNALEREGKAVFERACGQCHGGPGQSTPQATPNDPPAPVIRFHNILSQCPRPVDAVGRPLRLRAVPDRNWLAMPAPTPSRCRVTYPQPRPGSFRPGPSFAARRPIPGGRC